MPPEVPTGWARTVNTTGQSRPGTQQQAPPYRDRGSSSACLPGPRCEGWPGSWFRPVLAALLDRGTVLEPGEKGGPPATSPLAAGALVR